MYNMEDARIKPLQNDSIRVEQAKPRVYAAFLWSLLRAFAVAVACVKHSADFVRLCQFVREHLTCRRDYEEYA